MLTLNNLEYTRLPIFAAYVSAEKYCIYVQWKFIIELICPIVSSNVFHYAQDIMKNGLCCKKFQKRTGTRTSKADFVTISTENKANY